MRTLIYASIALLTLVGLSSAATAHIEVGVGPGGCNNDQVNQPAPPPISHVHVCADTNNSPTTWEVCVILINGQHAGRNCSNS